ncbi:MAG TPA: cytochrome c [Acidobacteriaceae bacterium]|nr:cytochrome c [Acidobacteriaceae bacterium]
MLKPFLFLPVLFLIGAPAFFQQTPTTPATPPAAAPAAPQTYSIPAEYVNMTNPVKPTPESLARAKQIYSWDCALCHGNNGNGKGDVAVEQKLGLLDLRDPGALKPWTDGELFYIIRNGKGKMPPEDGRAKDAEVWNLIIYLHSMSKGAAATTTPAS